MKSLKILKIPNTSLAVNFIYGIGNCILGFLTTSWWLITVGAYYTVLATTRFAVLQIRRKAKGNYDMELFAKRITGILLVLLSFCVMGVNVLSVLKERGTAFHEIIMITIATYTFTKITIAILGMIKVRHSASPVLKTLRNISLADACVSVYTMQRSMLVTFPGMAAAEIRILNILTGAAVWIVVVLLGVNLIGGKYIDMAKSKIVKTVAQSSETVTGGYKKIEQGVVKGYTKIEDKFVDAYLTKDGETVEEAKARLKKERK